MGENPTGVDGQSPVTNTQGERYQIDASQVRPLAEEALSGVNDWKKDNVPLGGASTTNESGAGVIPEIQSANQPLEEEIFTPDNLAESMAEEAVDILTGQDTRDKYAAMPPIVQTIAEPFRTDLPPTYSEKYAIEPPQGREYNPPLFQGLQREPRYKKYGDLASSLQPAMVQAVSHELMSVRGKWQELSTDPKFTGGVEELIAGLAATMKPREGATEAQKYIGEVAETILKMGKFVESPRRSEYILSIMEMVAALASSAGSTNAEVVGKILAGESVDEATFKPTEADIDKAISITEPEKPTDSGNVPPSSGSPAV